MVLCLGAIVLVATLARLALGLVYFGFHTGDDVEILQAGFMRALGWPYQPWHIRNLLVSELLAGPAITIASALNIASTQTLAWLATVPFVFLATVNICLVFRLAVRWLGDLHVGLLAAGLYAFHWLPLGYGSTVYPRTASTTCVLLATLALFGRPGKAWQPLLAGSLVALAWAVRYSEVIFLLPLVLTIWLEEDSTVRRVRGSVTLIVGFALGSVVTVGLVDWLTWGRPLSSLISFARYTLVERAASALEPSQPWYFYLHRLPKWLPLSLLPFLGRARRVAGSLRLAMYVLLPLLVLSLIHHKQLRYLQGIMPFVIIVSAGGAWSFWTAGRRRLAVVLCGLSLVLGVSGVTFLAKKSMAAVEAAKGLRDADPKVRVVGLSQVWAYGDDLYLGQNVDLLELSYPLRRDVLQAAMSRCDWIGFYEEELRRNEEAPALLRRGGFIAAGQYRWGKSKPVLLYRRSRQHGSMGAIELPGRPPGGPISNAGR